MVPPAVRRIISPTAKWAISWPRISANGLPRLPYLVVFPSLREKLDHNSGPVEWISPCSLPPRTHRRFSDRWMGYSPPRWLLYRRLIGIIHEPGGVSRERGEWGEGRMDCAGGDGPRISYPCHYEETLSPRNLPLTLIRLLPTIRSQYHQ